MSMHTYDVAIVGGGMAGMAVALRLQAAGLSTVILEAHGQPGGCAGFYRKHGFRFDVGATTLVDFAPGGIGDEFMQAVGLPPVQGEMLPGYLAWLPDRIVPLHRDRERWAAERARAFGDLPAHRSLWHCLDRLADVFWTASRRGIRLPLQHPGDLVRGVRALGLPNLPLVRYLRWTLGDLLRSVGLENDRPLTGLLAMLVEDTVHSRIDQAPLINAALGVTIRAAGLTRPTGGMAGFWTTLQQHYRALGGTLRVGCRVECIGGGLGAYRIVTRRGCVEAEQVVCALPVALTAQLAPPPVARALRPYLERDAGSLGGAIVVFLGVPEEEVSGQDFTHHQLLQDYTAPLGNGNNMFLSVSVPGDRACAPAGYRAVMISTHCELDPWEGLSPAAYQIQKQDAGDRLVALARRVYPTLGQQAKVYEVGTPRTYERYTGRPRGAVGGVRQSLLNANQQAVPHRTVLPGFWLAGDTTWPGLGTVACLLGSRIVAEEVLATLPAQHARVFDRRRSLSLSDSVYEQEWRRSDAQSKLS